jgi:E3 ubiquitin-protein ligase HOS1
LQNALEQLASIDLIELCKEARIEHCRATRDLSSCGRYVQHVLNSCGHASLCAECSQRCDVCPICRSPIPDTGNRVRLRLYYKCLEAGLISKQHDERFQEKEDHSDPVNLDVQRLHSLFDVALQNNLASLICHYTTDVCLDENAVSSDPLLAFLLDEVVIKEWCKKAVNALISEINMICIQQMLDFK